MKQKLRVFLTLLLCAVASVGWGDTYKKIISSSAFSTGQYLIVYEGESLALSGSGTTAADIKKGTKVKITNDQIDATTTTNAIAVLITASGEDNYLIQTVSGYYIYNTSSTNNGFSVTQNLNTAGNYPITINFDESGNANIISSGNYLRYNPSANSPIFNFYKAASYSSQKAINLYKLESGGTPSLEDNDLSLSPTSLTFDLYNNSNAKAISYTTSSTGAISVSESEYVTTTVDETNKTITVTPKKKTSSQTITVLQEADDTYAAGEASFTVKITDSTPHEQPTIVEIGLNTDFFETTEHTQGSATEDLSFKGESDNVNVTFDVAKGQNYYINSTQIRLYSSTTTLTFEAPEGYNITGITFEKDSRWGGLTSSVGTINEQTWSGKAESVEFSASARTDIKSATVTLEVKSNKKPADVTISGDLVTDLDGQTNVNAGTLTAVVSSEGVDLEGATVTWESNAPSVATIDANGAVTLLSAGEVTFTATYAGNDEYDGATATKTITVVDSNVPGSTAENPYTVAQARAAINAGTGVTGVYATGTVSEIVTAYDSHYGNISYNISADGETTSDQLQAFRGKSYDGAKFTSENDIQVGDVVVIYGNLTKYGETYEFAADNQLVSLKREKSDATILVEDASVVYGNTFTIDTEVIEGGEITVTSSNTSVATVNGLVITPQAVGETTITVATAENERYNAGSETFTLTVTQPEGQNTAPTGSSAFSLTTIFKDKDLGYDEGMDWESSIAATAFETANGARGVQFGTAKGEFTLSSSINQTVTKVSVVLSTNAAGNTIAVKVGGNDFTSTYGGLEEPATTISLESGIKNETIEFTGTGTGSIVISIDDKAKSIWIKSITVSSEGSEAPAITVTLNGNGYATFCSQYPLDFTNNEDVTAWALRDIENNDDGTYKMNYTQITGAVKGGVGMLLKGEATDKVEIKSKNCEDTDTPDTNLFVGTLAPTFVKEGAVYGLSGDTFVKNSKDGTVKANKAFIYARELPADAKSFIFVFEDETTGIRTMETHSAEEVKAIFNIAGQRLQNMQKGINIVGGKKILVK